MKFFYYPVSCPDLTFSSLKRINPNDLIHRVLILKPLQPCCVVADSVMLIDYFCPFLHPPASTFLERLLFFCFEFKTETFLLSSSSRSVYQRETLHDTIHVRGCIHAVNLWMSDNIGITIALCCAIGLPQVIENSQRRLTETELALKPFFQPNAPLRLLVLIEL